MCLPADAGYRGTCSDTGEVKFRFTSKDDFHPKEVVADLPLGGHTAVTHVHTQLTIAEPVHGGHQLFKSGGEMQVLYNHFR